MTGIYNASPDYTPEEIRAHREQWLEELRSGDRQQVQGYLSCPTDQGEQGFCCLGVATELAGVTYIEYDGRPRQYGADTENLTLPREAQQWLGVSDSDPWLGFDTNSQEDWDFAQGVLAGDVYDELRDSGPGHLTGALLNDQGATFAQIADLFERFGFAAEHDDLQGAEPEVNA